VGVVGAAVDALLSLAFVPLGLGIMGPSPVSSLHHWHYWNGDATHKPSDSLGSMAAGIQAGIGSVAAGSVFAVAPSVAMGGAISAVVTAIVAGIAGVGATIAAAAL